MTTINEENAKQIRQGMNVIIQVTPEQGSPITITNENLISCTVSLRSDLSIIEPTLPESEINIEAYFDTDISDTLASIPDETPVTYQAGYAGDMSPVRNFYLAEQITWKDNVMSIHAVDAVCKLDSPIGTAMYMSTGAPSKIVNSAMGLIEDILGIAFSVSNPHLAPTTTRTYFVVDEGFTIRDYIAQVQWLMHQEDNLWYTYVDAGRPKFTWQKPSSTWDIYEEDCGDVQRQTDRVISNIKVQHKTIRRIMSNDLGDATIIKNVGTSLSFNTPYVTEFVIGVANNTRNSDKIGSHYSSAAYDSGILPIVPVTVSGKSYSSDFPEINHRVSSTISYTGLERMLRDGIAQSDFRWIGSVSSTHEENYTQFVPWSCTYDTSDSYWTDNPGTTDIRSQNTGRNVLVNSGIIGSTDTEAGISIGGTCYEMTVEPQTFSSGNDGIDITIEEPPWFGSTESITYGEAYPSGAYNSILSRSNITGSFTWKGDPRMQPRDVATFHRLDGTTETITIENITLSHEEGGLSAEITYRCGIC